MCQYPRREGARRRACQTMSPVQANVILTLQAASKCYIAQRLTTCSPCAICILRSPTATRHYDALAPMLFSAGGWIRRKRFSICLWARTMYLVQATQSALIYGAECHSGSVEQSITKDGCCFPGLGRLLVQDWRGNAPKN